MINRETIWDETYRNLCLEAGQGVSIDVLTAIHHSRISSSLSVIQRIGIDIDSQPGSTRISVELNSNQMRELAAHLNHAADRAEELELRLDDEVSDTKTLEAA